MNEFYVGKVRWDEWRYANGWTFWACKVGEWTGILRESVPPGTWKWQWRYEPLASGSRGESGEAATSEEAATQATAWMRGRLLKEKAELDSLVEYVSGVRLEVENE